jgi:hypothetical protein
MSWVRKFYDGASYSDVPGWGQVLPINYTSGYWALNQSEEDYGPEEKNIAELLTATPIPYPAGYVIPQLEYWTSTYAGVALTAPRYSRCRTSVLVVGYPEIDEYGYFHTSYDDDGEAYKSNFRAGFQQKIYDYSATDVYDGINTGLAGLGTGGPDLQISTGGLPDEMTAAIEFYKNGYSEALFITSFTRYYAAGTTHVDPLTTASTFVQVPYSAAMFMLNVTPGQNLMYDPSHSWISADTLLPTPTDEHIAIKKLPTYYFVDNSEDYTETVPGQFYIDYYTMPSTYPQYKNDLKSRFKTTTLIEEQSIKYVDEKVSILKDMLDSLLVMPKEFRVRMQTSQPYNLANISSMPDGERMSPTTTSGMTGGSTGGGSTGGGSTGGSY